MPQAIHHIVLTISNLKKSVEFYKKVLGWVVTDTDHKEWSALAPKGQQAFLWIGIPRDGNKKPKSKFDRNNIGLDHFAFEVEFVTLHILIRYYAAFNQCHLHY